VGKVSQVIGSNLRANQPWQRLLALGLVFVLSLSLSSCNPNQFVRADADVPRIVSSVLSEPRTFNAVLSQESPNIFGYTYEGLTDSDGITGDVIPGLAESWDISEDGQTIVFTLREGLRWSDGEPLTADDVLFTFNDLIFNPDIPTSTRDVLRIGQEGLLPTVSKVDDRRIQFDLPEPFAPFLRTTGTSILPEHVLRPTIEQQDSSGNLRFLSTWGTDTNPQDLVVNGPYTLQQYIPGERLIFERNPYYWKQDDDGNPQPYIRQVVWQIVESTDNSIVQFRSGGLDLISVTPDSFTLLKREEERGDFTIYEGGPALGTNFLAFNLNRGSRNGQPLVNPVRSRWFNMLEFRQAVAYALDRDRMIINIFQGLGEAQTSPISVQSPYFASPEEGVPSYSRDLDRARELLLSAGFEYNDAGQLFDDEGNRVRFTLITNSGNNIRESLGAQVAQDLGDIGMRVDFQPIAFNSLVERLSDSLDWECHLLGLTGGLEPNNGFNVWSVDGSLHAFNQNIPSGPSAIEGWEVEPWEQRISDLYVEAAQVVDEDERRVLYLETQQLTQEYLPFIYLINPLSLSAVRNRIEGVQYSALGGALWNIHELELSDS
jgi:peptide/nickel transport system substrate-binding protein